MTMNYADVLDDDEYVLDVDGYWAYLDKDFTDISNDFPEHLTHIIINYFWYKFPFTAKLPPNLIKLDLSSTYFMSNDLKLPNSLEILRLRSCKLKTFNHKLPPNLKELDLSENLLTTIYSKLPPSLEIVKIEFCKLIKINSIQFNLKELSIGGNKLKKLKLSNTPSKLHFNINIKNKKTITKEIFYKT